MQLNIFQKGRFSKMSYSLERISHSLGSWHMTDFSLEIPEGKFVSIAGPSGCGKTTLLKILCGLEEPASGRVLFSGTDVSNMPPEKRGVGLVFQSDALFGHMDVLGNVSFGLEMRSDSEAKNKALAALRLVRLEGFEKREIAGLSGGERKRVAIARAIAFNPVLLLLDEPLNGLDASLREKMKLLLKEVQQKTGTTVVMVTHDMDEAFPLSDLVVVMNAGKVEQAAKPEEIFLFPATDFVKDFTSDYALVESKAAGKSGKPAQQSIPASAKSVQRIYTLIKKNNVRTGK